MAKTSKLIKDGPGKFVVITEDKDRKPAYTGPVIKISGNKDWIYVDGGYESNAMINREALPMLIKALQNLDKHLKSV